MIGSPEAPSFDARAFDEDFFAAYEQELADISIAEQASLALADVLTVQKADGTEKSYEELRDATLAFFTNDWVRNDEAVMNRMMMEFAQACMGHGHGADLAQDGQLGSIFEKGAESLSGDKHGHEHSSHDHEEVDEDEEVDPKTGKKKKKKKGWLGLLASVWN